MNFFSSVFSVMDVSTTQNDVKSILSQLDANKATGVDGIPARILKECAEELSYPLALSFNSSFRSGGVPSL